ncbi:transposase [Accumulibacter sp.]|uniref:transposase n=1 Tax=Accumulibacter sp. TaxID=2053492 RepID=UPI003DA90159
MGAIYPILVAHRPVRMASEPACRAFLVAVLWVLRSGAPWRLLPAAPGQWNPVFKCFSRGCRHGVGEALPKGGSGAHRRQGLRQRRLRPGHRGAR